MESFHITPVDMNGGRVNAEWDTISRVELKYRSIANERKDAWRKVHKCIHMPSKVHLGRIDGGWYTKFSRFNL